MRDAVVYGRQAIDLGAKQASGSATVGLSADARAILESMGDAFYALDGAWRFVYANRRALAFLGCRQEDILGRVIWDCFPALRGTLNEDAIRRARAEQQVVTFEAPSPVNHIWVRASVGPFGDGVTVYWRDITARRQSEQVLRDNEAHLRLAQEAAGMGTWDWDLRSGHIHWSSHMFALHGRTAADVPEDGIFALWVQALHPEDRDRVMSETRRHGESVEPFTWEFRIVHPGGKVRWLQSRGNVLADPDGRPARMLGVVFDITDRKRTEEALERRVAERTQALRDTVAALQRSRERNSAIFEHAPIDLAFLRVEPDGRFRCEDVNPAWIQSTGFSREQAVGAAAEEIFPPEHVALTLEKCRQAIATGGKVEYEYTATFPVGDVTRRCFLVPLHGPDGAVAQVLLTAVDLTETRRIEAQLRQAQKMEAIGQLTGGVAHDFNNLLTAVIGNLEMLGQSLTDERALRRVNAAMRAAQRGGQLTQQLLAYARRQNLTPQPVDANAVMAGMAELLQRSLGGLVQVEMDLAPGLWLAHSDPTQLELMVLNLAINARDAMPAGGSLRLATRNLPAHAATLPPDLAPGPYVAITVSDTGSGMPPEVLEHAFEPFFTTKEVGKGSGLGLAQVYGLACQFGGTARLGSVPGQGTTVEVFLPRAERRPDGPETVERKATGAEDGAGIVLVVDDDADVRLIAAEMLREAGYLVREAGSGPEALSVLADIPVSVMLADYAMPVMSGAELARLARARHPWVSIVYLTGNADPLGPEAVHLGDRVITKPYTSATLLSAVQQAMRG
ncbi:MAG: PAS domain S-box protein [Acetobacteraceae bacterium]|nr:PAS domain S-box protein [Acetobacteraceae bacterium]